MQRHAASDQWSWRQLSGVENAAPTLHGNTDSAAQALQGQRLILVLCGLNVSRLKVDLPLRGVKLLAAAPYALEDSLAEDIDDLHFSVAPVVANHAGVYLVRHDWLQAELEAAQALEPGEIVAAVPEYALLPEATDTIPCLACAADAWWLQLSDSSQFKTLQTNIPGLRELLTTAEGVRFVSIGGCSPPEGCSITQRDDVATLLDLNASIARLRQHNLLHGLYAQRNGNLDFLKRLRIPAALAATALVAHTLLSAWVLHGVKQETDAAWQMAETQFQQTFPHITRIVDMRVQASQELAVARAGGSNSAVLELLKTGAVALSQTPELSLDNVQFRDAALYLSLSGKNLQALETLRAKLEREKNVRLEVQSAQAGSDGVQIRLKLEKA